MSSGSGWSFLDDAPVDTDRYARVQSPLKFYVLAFCEEHGAVDYTELAEALGMPPDYAADRLMGYANSGLLDRTRPDDGGRSTYRLTDRGRDRLQWFRDQ